MIKGKRILVTGSAGFIGYHLVKSLCHTGNVVIGLDNINDYYDVNLKYGRLEDSGIEKEKIERNRLLQSKKFPEYRFIKADLTDKVTLNKLFESEKIDYVVNLAAQAGVRYSLQNPYAYIDSNIIGFLNILEMARHYKVKHLVFASSSSVYGLNKSLPFSTSDNVDHPISLYAATKKSNELMAHTYSYLYGIPVTGLRFFTVYGPWGRPDMALFLFTKSILENKPIDVYNYGKMQRDFTYVDDIVKGVSAVIEKIPEGNKEWKGESPDPSSSVAPYKIFNIGNNQPVKLEDFINIVEKELNRKAIKNYLGIQPGDVDATWANIDSLFSEVGFKPEITVQTGIRNFISWYKEFYKVVLT